MQLLRQGLKLAVLGVDPTPGGDKTRWHAVQPGSTSTSAVAPGELRYGTPLCAFTTGLRYVATNGYPADWKPPIGSLCPACAERL